MKKLSTKQTSFMPKELQPWTRVHIVHAYVNGVKPLFISVNNLGVGGLKMFTFMTESITEVNI